MIPPHPPSPTRSPGTRRRGAVVGWLAPLLAACASTPPGATAAPVAGLPFGSAGGGRGVGLEVTRRNDGVAQTIAAPPARVFAALEGAYQALGIPLTRREPQHFLLANEGTRFRRRFAGYPTQRLFDCGGTSGMPNAETYTITASVLTVATPAGADGTTLTTTMQASGENPNFTGSGVACASNGVLEERIVAEVRARLGGGPP